MELIFKLETVRRYHYSCAPRSTDAHRSARTPRQRGSSAPGARGHGPPPAPPPATPLPPRGSVPDELTNVLHRGRAPGQQPVVIRALGEPGLGLDGAAQLEQLGEAVEVRGELRARQPGALPLADCLTVLLERLVLHQRQGGLLVHRAGVDV